MERTLRLLKDSYKLEMTKWMLYNKKICDAILIRGSTNPNELEKKLHWISNTWTGVSYWVLFQSKSFLSVKVWNTTICKHAATFLLSRDVPLFDMFSSPIWSTEHERPTARKATDHRRSDNTGRVNLK